MAIKSNILKISFICSLFLLAFAAIDSDPNARSEKVAMSSLHKTHQIGDRIENFKKWKGTFHYELDYQNDVFESNIKLLEMKGLRGEDVDRITLDGNIVFTPKVGNSIYVGSGVVKYSVSLMHYASIGEAMVIHFTDGKGSAKIKPFMERVVMEREDIVEKDPHDVIEKQISTEYGTGIRFNYRNRTYDIRITPGDYDAHLDEFGVPVESSSRIKVTNAMIRKLDAEGRPILYPETLKEMFPDRSKEASRLNVGVEAFGMPFSSSSNTLKGTYTDEKGGVLTWNFKSF